MGLKLRASGIFLVFPVSSNSQPWYWQHSRSEAWPHFAWVSRENRCGQTLSSVCSLPSLFQTIKGLPEQFKREEVAVVRDVRQRAREMPTVTKQRTHFLFEMRFRGVMLGTKHLRQMSFMDEHGCFLCYSNCKERSHFHQAFIEMNCFYEIQRPQFGQRVGDHCSSVAWGIIRDEHKIIHVRVPTLSSLAANGRGERVPVSAAGVLQPGATMAVTAMWPSTSQVVMRERSFKESPSYRQWYAPPSAD